MFFVAYDPNPSATSIFLSVLFFGWIPTDRARTCCIIERVIVCGLVNERHHRGAIHIDKVTCGILVDTVTSTVTQYVRVDAI